MATGSIVRRETRHSVPVHRVQYAQPITSHQLAPPQMAHEAAPQYHAPRRAAPAAGYVGGTGVAVIAGQGDSAAILARRYNVPEATLLRANGFTSAAQVQPGTHLIIPFRQQESAANASAVHASRQQMAAARQETHGPHIPRMPLAARNMGGVTYSQPDLAPRSLQQQAAAAPHIPVATALAGAAVVGGGAFALTRMHELAEIKKYRSEAAAAQAELAKARKAQQNIGPTPTRKLAAAKAAKVAATQKKLALLQQHEAALHAKKLAESKQAKSLASSKLQQGKLAKAKLQKADRQEAFARNKVEAARGAAAKKLAMARSVPAAVAIPSAPKIDTKTPTGSIAMAWPVHGRIIRGFQPGVNDGINISVPNGTAVHAVDGGVVAYAGSQLKGYGNLVLIRHPNGFISAYADNGALDVKRGQSVSRGQVIAHSGQSGDVSSPQLHFELRKGTVPVNPTHFLAGT